MPVGTCDPASRGDAYNEVDLEYPLPDSTGSVLAEIRYGWDGRSVKPDCDGPISLIHTRNTGQSPAWVLLPGKKKPPLWVQIDPGTDVTTNSPGTLKNLGLVNYSDLGDITVAFTQPA